MAQTMELTMPMTEVAIAPQFLRDLRWRQRAGRLIALAAGAAMLSIGVAAPASADDGTAATDHDLARTAVATASAHQNNQDGDFPASNVIDGDEDTRWSSGTDDDTSRTADPQWLQLDLGATGTLDAMDLTWEDSYAASYSVEVATSDPDDAGSWQTVANVTDGQGAEESVDLGGVTARYVRLVMTEEVEQNWDPNQPHYYGYSLYTVAVLGVADDTLVAFQGGTASIDAGDTAEVGLVLNQPLAADGSVHVTSLDGSASSSDGDYGALDEDIAIPAGETEATIKLQSFDHDGPSGTADLTLELSDPSAGLHLADARTYTVVITTVFLLPSAGTLVPQLTFEDGVDDWATFADEANQRDSAPVIASVQADRAGSDAKPGSNHVMSLTHPDPVDSWAGAYDDFSASQNWKDGDAVSFWFKGANTGEDVAWDIKSIDPDSGTRVTYAQSFTDDSTDWRQITVPFSELAVDTNNSPDSAGVPFNPRKVDGVAITTTPLSGSAEWLVDDWGYISHVGLVDDFEGTLPWTNEEHPVGIFTWSGGGGVAPDLSQYVDDVDGAMPEDNNVLGGTYQIGTGWGGFNVNHDAPMDWSDYGGIRFWWYASQNNQPTSPTAGDDVTIELREDGDNADQSELWDATFKDSWGSDGSRWKLVSIPFSDFQLRGDFQPTGQPIDGKLTLKKVWGYDFNLPVVADERDIAIDQVVVYGAARSASDVTVSADPDVVLVDAGDSATVSVAATTVDGNPLTSDVTVHYATGDGSAIDGTDYTATDGDLTIVKGTESGESQSFTIATSASDTASEAKTIPISLSSEDGTVSGSPKVVINAHGLPYLDPELSNADRADDLLGRMSQKEKVGQMTQAERLGLTSVTDIADLGLGSVLSGGGSVPADNSAQGWATMVDGFQRQAMSTPLQIPILYGVDAVHGHNNVVGATIFPHNIGMGATHDPALEAASQHVTAQEVRATGVQWAFSPCLCVTRDKRWGRTYESFSEDPALVTDFSRQAITGLQGNDPSDMSGPDKVLATAKHWLGDGGTEYGSGRSGYPIDQGNTKVADMDELTRLYVDPYVPAIDAGVGSIMPSYSSVQIGSGPSVQMHEATDLNTGLLKDQLGFSGFMISDYEGINKLPGNDYADKSVRSVNSGVDMAMAPYDYKKFIEAIEDGLDSDEVEQSRVGDAVRRILQQKFALGLFEEPFSNPAHADEVGSPAHRAVARKAAAKSQVLLKNDGVLPLSTGESVYVTGSSSNDIGRQTGGWTISWQGMEGDITPGTTIGQALVDAGGADHVTLDETGKAAPSGHYDVGVVVVGETPYAEGVGDIGNTSGANTSFDLSSTDQATVDAVCGSTDVDTCVVLVVSGRPQILSGLLDQADGLVASYLPGTEGEGVADVLYGDVPFTGRLPETWLASSSQARLTVGDDDYTPEFAYGWGLRTDSPRARLEKLDADLGPSAGRTVLRRLLGADVWASDGSVSDAAVALPLVQQTAAELAGAAHVSDADPIVTVARDLAQQAVVAGSSPADHAKLTSDAEHDWAAGQPAAAVRLLAGVAGVTLPASGDEPIDLSDDATLSGISVSGTPITGFDPAVTSYQVTVPAAGGVPAVTATAADSEADVQVSAADSLPGTTTITVTAADGTTVETYAVDLAPVNQPFRKEGKVKVKVVKGHGKRLGSTLKAVAKRQKPTPDTVTYQWYRGSKKLKKATKPKLKLHKKLLKKRIHVVATLHKAGYTDHPVTSKTYKVKKAASKSRIKKIKVKKHKGHKRLRVVIRVRAKSPVKVKGKVKVLAGKKKKVHKIKTVKVHPIKKKKGKAKAKVLLPKRFKVHKRVKIKAKYRGTAKVAKSAAKVVRKG